MQRHENRGAYAGNPAENYERYFVPAIGVPLAMDLIEIAALRAGERVLDVACGTGVVARMACGRVGNSGVVAGVDINPGMLAVARSMTPADMAVEWHEGSAEVMPFEEGSFDAVLCQMGLQFIPDKQTALCQMRRVLAPKGRLFLTVPGPTPQVFTILGDALARHVAGQAAGFVHQVFSLHDVDEIQTLVEGAGFSDVSVRAATRSLRLPPPEEFLWQYVHGTPLAGVVAPLDDERREALTRDFAAGCSDIATDGGLLLSVRMVTVTARSDMPRTE